MNLVPLNPSLTMSSREIAELVEKRHDNVKRTIEALIEKAVISHPQIEDGQKSANGVVEKLFMLNKRDSLIVVAQLCPEFTAKIVDRWQELEAQQAVDPMKILNDPAAMRGLLLGYTEKVLELESTVAIQAPKVAALDRLATHSDGSFCVRDAAKTLQIQEKALRRILQEKRWIYRRPMGSGWLAYSDKLQQGLMEHKMTHGEKTDGSEWTDTQARITAKGMAKLAEILSMKGEAA